MQSEIETFLRGAREPYAVEPGQEPVPLVPGDWELDGSGGRLVFQAWSREANLVRRVVRIAESGAGRMELEIERFGKKTGSLLLLDKAHRAAEKPARRAGRLVFREWMRRALARHFAGWKLRELSTDADLEHSLSPAYARAFVSKGAAGWAAIGAGPDSADVDGALTFGLIWLDYLRRRQGRQVFEGLAVFVPEGRERTTCLRARCLDVAVQVFVYAADGWEQRIDIADAGNLETELPVRDTHSTAPAWTATLDAVGERVDLSADHVSWRVHGLEFARWNGIDVRFGVDGRERAREAGPLLVLARDLAVRRKEPSSPLYLRAPERWLESELRRDLPGIDAALLPAPVYGQVPTIAGVERGVLDLLACGFDGRLAVIEVKASEDPQLPMQALDYWMRVRWHAERQEFGARGYFPGVMVASRAPRLLLVGPALCFHPTTEIVLRFFSSAIEVVRIGVGMNWRNELKVVSRLERCEDIRDESCSSADAGAGRHCASEPA